MSNRTRMLRVSERVHELAERLDPEGRKGRAVELALEVLHALAQGGDYPHDGGPLTGRAVSIIRAYELGIRREMLGAAVKKGIEAYKAEKFFEGREGDE